MKKYAIGHGKGSSHGDSRIFRTAYWEGHEYVALARKSRDLWVWLNQYSKEVIYNECGGVYVGSEGSPLVNGVLNSANSWKIDVSARSPESVGVITNKNHIALEEKHAGVIYADRALLALKEYCLSVGVNIFENSDFNRPVSPNKIYVFAIGPWLAKSKRYRHCLSSDRVYCHWFKYGKAVKIFEKAFLLQGKDGRVLYGMQPSKNIVKVGWHNYPVIPLAPWIEEASSPEKYILDIEGALSRITNSMLDHVKSQGCYFTNSLDENYIVDREIGSGKGNVWNVGGLSGHGFKFAPALGFFVAKSIFDGYMNRTLSIFDSSRFMNEKLTSRTTVREQDLLIGDSWHL